MNEDMLNSAPQADELQGALRLAVDAIRAAAPPDFDPGAWQPDGDTPDQATNADHAQPAREATLATRKKRRRQRLLLLGAATATAICVWLGIGMFHRTTTGPNDEAFAGTFSQIAHQIGQSHTVTWKSTEYLHATDVAGTAKWLVTRTSSHFYRSPGLWRSVEEHFIYVADGPRGKSLTLLPAKKQAIVTKKRPSTADPQGGPFQQFQKMLKEGNLQWLEKRTLSTGEVANVFRHTERDENNRCYRTYDFWIDAQSKRLVKVNHPGPRGELYHPEKDPIRDNRPGKEACSWEPLGTVWHDIVFDARLDDSLFSLQPPQGYTVKREDRTLTMTEEDMLEYLGAFVDFHGRMFPDEAFPSHYNLDALNAALAKPTRKQTAIERKYLALFERYHRFRISTPFECFRANPDVVEQSFRYVGKGVKLGDQDRIVCWYKLKNATDAQAYRVVYGDLSVKDVAAKDLPLPVER